MWLRKIVKIGNSLAVVLPSAIVKVERWRKGDVLAIGTMKDGRVVLEGLDDAIERKKPGVSVGCRV